jgi:hypothetical protein
MSSNSVNVSSYVNRIVRSCAKKRFGSNYNWSNMSMDAELQNLEIDKVLDRVEIKRSYSMNELGDVDNLENLREQEILSLKNFGDHVGARKSSTHSTKSHQRKMSLNAKSTNKKPKKKKKVTECPMNSVNTSLIPSIDIGKNPTQTALKSSKFKSITLTDEFIKNSIKDRKSKLRDKLERKLGLSQFSYAKKQNTLYSS